MPALSSLSQEADAYLRALAERELAHASGRSSRLGLEELVHAHGVLARPETFHELRELAARGGEETRRAERLQALVAQTLLRVRAAPHEEAIHTLERDGS